MRTPTDRLVYHVVIGSVVGDFVRERPETLIVDHHNLTPLRYLDEWEPVVARGVVWGRRQLTALAARCSLGIGDSRFNEAELIDAGYARTTVVPILIPTSALAGPVDTDLVTACLQTESPGARWLFVGRLSPNKAQQDLVKALAAYRRSVDDRGGSVSRGRVLVAPLRVRAAPVRRPPRTQRRGNDHGFGERRGEARYYTAADVFVVASEHEGFCIPLVEAMHHRVPIVAYEAGAVGETIDAAGIRLETKEPSTIAAAVARVVADPQLRAHLVEAGVARAGDFDIARTGPLLLDAVADVEVRR